MTDSWYLAASKPRQESKAVQHLENQGIFAFSPIIQVEKVRAGKKILVEEALFAGYLFINISSDSEKWHKVRSTRGVRDWIRFAGNVAKLPNSLIQPLISLSKEKAQNSGFKPIKKGDFVRVLSGPFEGLKGVFESQCGEKRSMILIEFLGSQNRLQVDNEQIIVD